MTADRSQKTRMAFSNSAISKTQPSTAPTTTIFRSDGTVRTRGAQPPDALEVLRRIAAWPANSNSEPNVMGDALDEIQELASHTIELLAPPNR